MSSGKLPTEHLKDPEEIKALHDMWFNESKFKIDFLGNWRHKEKTGYMHQALETKVAGDFAGACFNSSPFASTIGDSPEYDISLRNQITLEIKASSYYLDDKPVDIWIETGTLKQDTKVGAKQGELTEEDSGLSKSRSDYYMLMQPGKWGSAVVLKVRILPTEFLRMAGKTRKKITYNGSVGFWLNPFDLECDGLVGYYSYDPETKIVDLSSCHLAGSQINEFKKQYLKKDINV